MDWVIPSLSGHTVKSEEKTKLELELFCLTPCVIVAVIDGDVAVIYVLSPFGRDYCTINERFWRSLYFSWNDKMFARYILNNNISYPLSQFNLNEDLLFVNSSITFCDFTVFFTVFFLYDPQFVTYVNINSNSFTLLQMKQLPVSTNVWKVWQDSYKYEDVPVILVSLKIQLIFVDAQRKKIVPWGRSMLGQ